ncbi:SPX domain-containing protein [Cerioporus squamosus]|nr:SPX domain-containing protein [Cerioporus squamosus]
MAAAAMQTGACADWALSSSPERRARERRTRPMHFSKTYAQLLLTLPPELRESAIQYRQLKKIINQIVAELTSLGLSPDILQGVLQPAPAPNDKGKQREGSSPATPPQDFPRVVYELAHVADHVEPRLHVYLQDHIPQDPSSSSPSQAAAVTIPLPLSQDAIHLALAVPTSPEAGPGDSSEDPGGLGGLGATIGDPSSSSQELIIPLASDTAFFRTLCEALESLSAYLVTKRADFEKSLQTLSHDISSAARPSSSSSSFHPYSPFTSDAANISLSTGPLALMHKSDLETWRQIFQLYVEADIFQGHQERFRGERDVEDAEARLAAFTASLQESLANGSMKLKLKRSHAALNSFMELNTFILNLRKFQSVTSEATRKILKKHAKRTALPLAPDLASPFTVSPETSQRAMVLARSSPSSESLTLSLLLVQALTETLLPIIPHIDDYSCVICTSLAFKPIRLRCSHLFCVRCLVKLQKRGEQHCPMCRAPTVLSADRSNVDWALLNFMKDWFPGEARKKLQQNEREAAEEEMQELGLDMRGCIVM